MNARRRMTTRQPFRGGFTLTELLVVIMVISILASSVMFAMYGAIQQAKESRTKAQITKLHELLMTRWDSYRTRAVRVALSPSLPLTSEQYTDANGNGVWDSGETYVDRNGNSIYDWDSVAARRLNALRELMRLEMPDRISDVQTGSLATAAWIAPLSGIPRPSLANSYFRRARATQWNEAGKQNYQGPECLYLIISSISDVGGNGLDFLYEGEIGDVDEDGMPEILDAWGNPIDFIRWPGGHFASPGLDDKWGVAATDDDSLGGTDDIPEAYWTGSDDKLLGSVLIDRDPSESPDLFDPLRVHPATFALYPLVYSAGPDGKYDVNRFAGLDYSNLAYPSSIAVPDRPYYFNNPYYFPVPPAADPFIPAGTPMDVDGDEVLGFVDNISNHSLEVR